MAKAAGHSLDSLTRSPLAARKLTGMVDQAHVQDVHDSLPSFQGIDVVVSALGAPVTLASREKRSYHAVDTEGNKKLLAAARAARVPRFVYVSAHLEPSYRNTAYISAHEEFVDELRQAELSHSVIRPTGIFSAFNEVVELAKKGRGFVVGDGSARTNPVHQKDVAAQLVACLSAGPAEVSIGGPEIFTRSDIVELAFRVVGKQPQVMRVPKFAIQWGAKLVCLRNPRLGELFEFVTLAATNDCVAPSIGNLRLEDHFKAIAAGG